MAIPTTAAIIKAMAKVRRDTVLALRKQKLKDGEIAGLMGISEQKVVQLATK
jgi:DNA-directed RNA polymerase specialized sigma subunit